MYSEVDLMEEKIFALMEKMYAEILNLKDGQVVLAQGYKRLEESQKIFAEDARKLGAKIDGEVLPKITALYDDSSMVHEKLNEMNDKIDNLQVRANNLAMDTLINSNKIIELDKKVKNVSL